MPPAGNLAGEKKFGRQAIPVEYPLIRSRRKTVGIYMRPDGSFEVRAPLRLPKSAVDEFVRSKEKWIREKSSLLRQRQQAGAAAALRFPERLPLLGRDYPVEQGAPAAFTGVSFRLPGPSPQEARAQAAALYRSLAAGYLPRRAAFWQEKVGADPASLRVGSAKGSWGSCSGKNGITFSWRLMAAPPEAVDYVVVHELCHILEHNHSPRFWALVARQLPHWQALRASLAGLARRLEELGL